MNIVSTSSSSSIPLNDSAASSNGSSSDDDDDVDEDEVDDEGIGESLVSISITDCLNKKKKCTKISVKINDQRITAVIR